MEYYDDEIITFSSKANNTSTGPGGLNSQLIYQFDNPVNMAGCKLGLQSLFLIYAWFNISSSYGNTVLQYIWKTSSGNVVRTVNFEPGLWAISDLNNFMQAVMIANGDYLVDNLSNNIFFLTFQANSVFNTVTLTSTPVPSSLPVGWTNPGSAYLSGFGPQLLIPADGSSSFPISQVLGFPVGTYPAVMQTTEYQLNSPNVPQVTNVNSVNVLCNLLQSNIYTNQSQSLYSFSPNVSAAAQIQIIPAFPIFLKCVANSMYTLSISLVDDSGAALQNNSSEMSGTLIVRRPLQLESLKNR